MEDEEITTYEPLERPSMNADAKDDSGQDSSHVPKDQKHVVYLALLAAGIGFVLPYNSFIIAADYWQTRFPGQTVALDMSMTYIAVAFATVVLNNVFLTLAPFRVRVLFGYIISFTTLIFVAIFEVAWHLFAASWAYSVNLAAVSLVAIGCTVQQSSFYGFASMFPKHYTQAVMAGESIAGFLVSSNRVMTKLLIQNDRVSTVIFFLTSTLYIIFSYLLHLATIHSPFVRYHMKACTRIVLRPDENHLDDIFSESGNTNKFNGLEVGGSSETTATTGLSFSNPVYELSNPTVANNLFEDLKSIPTDKTNPLQETNRTTTTTTTTTGSSVAFKVEHVISPNTYTSSGKFQDFRAGFTSRWRVAQAIYPYMVCIALTYCVTLSLYPGIESEIISCNLSSWLPVLLMFAFNTADIIGKILAAIPYPWSRRQLILMSGLRIVLVPLLLLCCAPRHQPVISGEAAAFFFTIALGISNGLAGSLPMMLAPAKVPATLKEVTGNIMTLSYNVGLTAGSLIGYVFEHMLGPQLVNPCPTFPYSAVSIYNQNEHTLFSTAQTFVPALTTTMFPTSRNTTLLTTIFNTGIIQSLNTTTATTTTTSIAAAAAATTTAASISNLTIPKLFKTKSPFIPNTSHLIPAVSNVSTENIFKFLVTTTVSTLSSSWMAPAAGAAAGNNYNNSIINNPI